MSNLLPYLGKLDADDKKRICRVLYHLEKECRYPMHYLGLTEEEYLRVLPFLSYKKVVRALKHGIIYPSDVRALKKLGIHAEVTVR